MDGAQSENTQLMNYEEEARKARLKVLELIYGAQTSHIGSNFSCIDILTVLFDKIDLNKDVFVLSAGWKAAALYYFLWTKEKITEDELNSYCKPESKFIGLAEPVIPEIKIAGGSMGLGLPGAIGIAFAKKIRNEEGFVHVLMSDGELQCGTTWESALIAAHHELDNLNVIVDNNKWQAMGKTEDILYLGDISEKFQQIGWLTASIDGHNHEAIELEFHELYKLGGVGPQIIDAHTIKGKGVDFMEGNNLYHYKQLSEAEYERARKQLYG